MTDDSEEVFRRAADGYPLRTDSADWEAVREKIELASQQTDDDPTGRKRNHRPWLLIFLLLPLVVIEHNYNFITAKAESEKASKGNVGVMPTAKARNTNSDVELQLGEKTALKDSNGNSSQGDGTSFADANAHKAYNNGIDGRTEQPVKSYASTDINNGQRLTARENSKRDLAIMKRTSSKGSIPLLEFEKRNKTENLKNVINESDEGAVAIDDKQPQNTRNKSVLVSKPRTNISITNGETAEIETASAIHDDEINTAVKDNILSPASTNDSGSQRLIASEQLKPESLKTDGKATAQAEKNKTKEQHVYAGVIGGLDFSSIKFQSVDKTGFSFGFIAGYKFSNRLSIETGLLKDKKQYTSAGKYFSTKNIRVYNSASIESVSGECNMWEVPLNINYSFSKRNKSSWFVSAGASAYFMQKEAYVFEMKRYGLTYPYAAKYKNKDNEFVAVLNFSGGYTHQLGRICDLRIQPYIKIPVSKVGTGELPIQSAGIMLAFTRNIF